MDFEFVRRNRHRLIMAKNEKMPRTAKPLKVNRRSAEVSSGGRLAGGGVEYYPPPPQLTHEPAAVARWARRQSKAPNECLKNKKS